jgi:carboxymethylenebutenolidase
MPDISIASGTQQLPGYLAVPEGEGPWPGVVVIHELFGLTDDIRAITDRFAVEGYTAFAPDLLANGNRIACLVRLARSMSSGEGTAAEQIDASRRWLAGRDDATGHVGVAGFCLGGGFAIVMANSGFGASAVNYGRLPKNLDAAMKGSCPMVASYGELDGTLAGVAPRLEAALTAAGVEHDVKLYPGTGHSFLNHSAESTPGWMKPFTRSMHAGYVDTAATDAWERILAMFGSTLRPSTD